MYAIKITDPIYLTLEDCPTYGLAAIDWRTAHKIIPAPTNTIVLKMDCASEKIARAFSECLNSEADLTNYSASEYTGATGRTIAPYGMAVNAFAVQRLFDISGVPPTEDEIIIALGFVFDRARSYYTHEAAKAKAESEAKAKKQQEEKQHKIAECRTHILTLAKEGKLYQQTKEGIKRITCLEGVI